MFVQRESSSLQRVTLDVKLPPKAGQRVATLYVSHKESNEDKEFVYLEKLDLATYTSKPGDMVLLESPQNPRNEFYDYDYWVKLRSPGAFVAVDSTFAPPPLQFPLKHGVDIVMHSSTKYLGGHSDLLGGVLSVTSKEMAASLRDERASGGWNMGSLETWLLLRSLRTLEVRVLKQSATATALAQWLAAKSEPELQIVDRVFHTSVPGTVGHQHAKRFLKSGPACFAVHFKSVHHARLICKHLNLFVNATSLGGVESLIEWRFPIDATVDPSLVRISVGLEDLEDLKRDMLKTFSHVASLVENLPK
jgi:cystathionine gamma-synthase